MKTLRYIILTLFFLCKGFYGYCQATPIVIKDKYCGQGVIFPLDYKLPFVIDEGSKTFTPSMDDIILAEDFLLNNKIDVKYNAGLTGVFNPKGIKGRFNKYNRQYVGYKNISSDKIIIIHLLNFKKKKKAEKMFSNWEREYVIGLGGFYEENTVTFSVNLTQRIVSFF